MTNDHIAELLFSENVESALNSLGIVAWCILFSILLDPDPDDEFKHYFASLSGTIIFSDGEWLASYKLLDNGDVQVEFIIRDSDAL